MPDASSMPDVWFPNLHIWFEHLNRIAFTLFDRAVAWYGVLIAIGFLCGLITLALIAKRSKQSVDTYIDFFIYALIFGIIGARIYYVIFQWDHYKDNLIGILEIYEGGLAIYGGIILVMLVGVLFCLRRKLKFTDLLDTCLAPVAIGQAIGRWGNFMNQEAFGNYTESFFAMRLNVKTAYYTTPELLSQAVTVNGTTYLQVHPTFLYESVGCLIIFITCLLVWRKRKFSGEIASIYLFGYGLIRFFIEQLRTDSLMIGPFRVSVLVSAGAMLCGIALFIIGMIRYNKAKKQPDFVPVNTTLSAKAFEKKAAAGAKENSDCNSQNAQKEVKSETEEAPVPEPEKENENEA